MPDGGLGRGEHAGHMHVWRGRQDGKSCAKKKKNTSPNKREYAGGVKQLSKQTSDKEPIISSGRPFTKYFRSVATTHLGKI